MEIEEKNISLYDFSNYNFKKSLIWNRSVDVIYMF